MTTPIAPPPGAEATLQPSTLLGRAALAKRRLPKAYRHPLLDARLRDERTRDEGRLLLACRRAGVPVPLLYEASRSAATLVLEPVAGRTLQDQLDADAPDARLARLAALGAIVARLHAAGLVHGDLTLRNLLVPDPKRPDSLVLLDFGLGGFTQESEPRGVDLHNLEEALAAVRPDGAPLFAAFLSGYQGPGAAAALKRLEEIRERGRYR
jgi:Kae1-associated kinase Bud32